MARDRIGSGSIPPERRLEPDELWNLLIAYYREHEILTRIIRERSWEALRGGRTEFNTRFAALADLEKKVKPYVDRLPEELRDEIVLGVLSGSVQLLNVARAEFTSWYYREE